MKTETKYGLPTFAGMMIGLLGTHYAGEKLQNSSFKKNPVYQEYVQKFQELRKVSYSDLPDLTKLFLETEEEKKLYETLYNRRQKKINDLEKESEEVKQKHEYDDKWLLRMLIPLPVGTLLGMLGSIGYLIYERWKGGSKR